MEFYDPLSFPLKSILLALLFSSDSPLSIKDVQKVITRYHEEAKVQAEENASDDQQETLPISNVPTLLTAAQIRDALGVIAQELIMTETPYQLQEGPGGYRLVTAPRYSEWVRLLRDEPRPLKLSPAALETLAIIAYRQPVTRADMEKVRGVAVDSALNKLIDLGLIIMIGRADLPGRPTQYGTTEKFLELTGLTTLDALPSVEGLKSREIDAWLGQLLQQEEIPLESVL